MMRMKAPYQSPEAGAQIVQSSLFAKAMLVGTLALGVSAEPISRADTRVTPPGVAEAFQSASAKSLPGSTFEAVNSVTATVTPWPVTFKPRIPKQVIYYANKPEGYVTGNLTSADGFEDSGIKTRVHLTNRVWKLGRVVHKDYTSDKKFAWVPTENIKIVAVNRVAGICQKGIRRVTNRQSIGKDYNCPPHQCDGGSFYTPLKKHCDNIPLALNYDQRRGVAYGEMLPMKIVGGFHYRYTTPDGKRALGMALVQLPKAAGKKQSELNVWATTPRHCVPGHPRGGVPLKAG